MQKLNGNLTTIVDEVKHLTGHVQVSQVGVCVSSRQCLYSNLQITFLIKLFLFFQVPLRDCPSNFGEINFDYFLHLIAKSGYNGFVGLEYNATKEESSFDWLKKYLDY